MLAKVAVIGAGAAGLCCARHLSRYRPELFSFSVFERASQIGGTWLYGDRTDSDEYGLPVHSSMYKDLITNLPKELMLFPDFPFKEQLPSFVGHADMLEYLRLYAEHFGLHKYIKLHNIVEKVEPQVNVVNNFGINHVPNAGSSLDTCKWKVQAKDLETGCVTEYLFDFVIVCNGHFSKPLIPDIPGLGTFPGSVIHSCSYRTPCQFTGKQVLVVGAKASGTDIMYQIAPGADSVCLVYHTNPVKYKLPPNVELLPSIAEVDSNGTVHFENGERRTVDDIILCTGYQYHFPFLSSKSGVRVEFGKRVAPLYKHIFNIAHPSMAFIGLNHQILPFPLFNVQVQCVLSVFTGKVQLPSQTHMEEECETRFRRRLDQGYSPTHAHALENQFPYFQDLIQMADLKPLPSVCERLYNHVKRERQCDTENYRKYDYTIKKAECGDFTFTKVLRLGEKLV